MCLQIQHLSFSDMFMLGGLFTEKGFQGILVIKARKSKQPFLVFSKASDKFYAQKQFKHA